uniref:LEM domain-containing protein n=1 Tax=Rhabditophanes sp. KR3021 TaxID=114890 RepID=A0AC35UBL0_9BILA
MVDDVSKLSHDELRDELKYYGYVGPIMLSIRKTLEKKLLKLRKENTLAGTLKAPKSSAAIVTKSARSNQKDAKPTTPIQTRIMEDAKKVSVARKSSGSPSRTPPRPNSSSSYSETISSYTSTDNKSRTLPKPTSYGIEGSHKYTFNDKPSLRILPKPTAYTNDIGSKYSYSDSSSSIGKKNDPSFSCNESSTTNVFYDNNVSSTSPNRYADNYDDAGEEYSFKKSPPKSFVTKKTFIKSTSTKENAVTKRSTFSSKVLYLLPVIICLYLYWSKGGIDYKKQTDIIMESSKNTFSFFFNYAVFPVIVVALITLTMVGIYVFGRYVRNKKVKESRQIKETKDKIVNYLISVNRYQSNGTSESELFEHIFPKFNRTRRDKNIFDKALEEVYNSEVDFKYELHENDGIETKIYYWSIPLRDRWQGSALANNHSIRIPSEGLSNCLKIRGVPASIFKSKRNEVISDLRTKCIPYHFVHIQGICDEKETSVYIKLKSRDEANKVFNLLHSNWYNGELLTCKYITEEKYNMRFNL